MIRVENLWKVYDNITAVAGVSLEIEKGATMGIIGPNGSGKTTLLRMISTLAKPDHGSISVCGFDALQSPREIRRRISFMPAENAMPLDMTIAEYMDFFACAHGVPAAKRRAAIDEALELTEMHGRDGAYVRGLSTGNKQRLLLAKTLLGDPEVLILDEPASGLDPRARIEVREFLKELSNMGKTVVISSHILADIENICTDICILEQGHHKAGGGMEELRKTYAKPHRVMIFRVQPDQQEMALSLLAKRKDVINCAHDGERLLVSTTMKSCNPLLLDLLTAEIEILEMREEQADLERIFMESTKGVVS